MWLLPIERAMVGYLLCSHFSFLSANNTDCAQVALCPLWRMNLSLSESFLPTLVPWLVQRWIWTHFRLMCKDMSARESRKHCIPKEREVQEEKALLCSPFPCSTHVETWCGSVTPMKCFTHEGKEHSILGVATT